MANNHKAHHGKNLRRFREWYGWKQEALAFEMGDDWTQKKISLLEQKDVIEDEILKQLSTVLKVPVEAFDILQEESCVNFINNTISDVENFENIGGTGNTVAGNYINNPIEKWLEVIDENKKLYERLLQSEREKVEMLQELLKKK